jgi:cytochrome c-type biogenesis protein CcmF
MVQRYQEEKDVKMEIGETVSVGGYSFRFNGVKESERDRTTVALVGDIDLSQGRPPSRKMFPEKRTYVVSACR